MKFKLKNFSWHIVFIIIFIGLISISLVQTFSAIERKRQDSIRISLAARQTMIIQNYAKDFFYFLRTDLIEPLHNSIKTFEFTHLALSAGGKAPLEISDHSKFIVLEKSTSKKSEYLLAEIKKEWEDLKNKAVYIIDEKNRNTDEFKLFTEKANALSKKMSTVVTHYQATSERNLINLQEVQGLIFIIAITLFSISTYLLFKYRKLNDSLEETVIERTKELKEAQAKLVETARSAGMSEIATGVLHNVGNVLNSVNVSSELIMDSVIRSSKSNFFKAVEIIKDNYETFGDFLANDKKGQLTLKYIIEYSAYHKKELVTVLEELRHLNANLCHIKNIVSVQQTLSCQSNFIEEFTIKDAIDHALKINESALARHDIDLVNDIQVVSRIQNDKLKVIQVLTNLISNAKQSIIEMNQHLNVGTRL
jgi:signal transduction histidine kinase